MHYLLAVGQTDDIQNLPVSSLLSAVTCFTNSFLKLGDSQTQDREEANPLATDQHDAHGRVLVAYVDVPTLL